MAKELKFSFLTLVCIAMSIFFISYNPMLKHLVHHGYTIDFLNIGINEGMVFTMGLFCILNDIVRCYQKEIKEWMEWERKHKCKYAPPVLGYRKIHKMHVCKECGFRSKDSHDILLHSFGIIKKRIKVD